MLTTSKLFLNYQEPSSDKHLTNHNPHLRNLYLQNSSGVFLPHDIRIFQRLAKDPAQTKNFFMSSTETATFGTGCFWCTEAIYKELDGVISVMPGYSGGHTENPTYEEVCSGETGHAEATQVVYDPSKISYDELLEVFF